MPLIKKITIITGQNMWIFIEIILILYNLRYIYSFPDDKIYYSTTIKGILNSSVQPLVRWTELKVGNIWLWHLVFKAS